MHLKNKTIVITGGSSGIGLELVKQLSKANTIAVIAQRKNLQEEMSTIDPSIRAYSCDLSRREQVNETAEAVIKEFPIIDVLINNAAIQYNQQFTDFDFSPESIAKEIDINFVAVCNLTYLLLPALQKPSRSIVMNVNSGLGLAPKTNSAVYCATKAALNSFSKSLGYQLEKTNIKVLQAFMPLVDTPMTGGRGSGKMTAHAAARNLIEGLIKEKLQNDIGKVKLLRFLQRVSPKLTEQIMKRG